MVAVTHMESRIPELEELQRVAHWLAQRFWSEANAGNISVRLNDLPKDIAQREGAPPIQMPIAFPELSGEHFLVKGTGKRMRDVIHDLEGNIGLIRILPGGKAYTCLWGVSKVTSEFPAHSAIHQVLLTERPDQKAIVHTHPPGLAALTHLARFKDAEALSDVLFRMHTETSYFLHKQLAYLPYMVPGSIELGRATAEVLRTCKATLWDKHGVVAIGETMSQALDWIEILEKAAQIYWLVAGSGRQPVGLTDQQIGAMLKMYGLAWEGG
jgi:rhamnulose-1-phosphate aldolase